MNLFPHQIGRSGEDLAVEALEKMGYEIVERNFRRRGGEIDIIAAEGGDLVFVEVRSFKEDSIIDPVESISPLKRARILATAKRYAAGLPEDVNVRFDAVSIVTGDGESPKITIIRDILPSL